jgi:hypothetical protein
MKMVFPVLTLPSLILTIRLTRALPKSVRLQGMEKVQAIKKLEASAPTNKTN